MVCLHYPLNALAVERLERNGRQQQLQSYGSQSSSELPVLICHSASYTLDSWLTVIVARSASVLSAVKQVCASCSLFFRLAILLFELISSPDLPQVHLLYRPFFLSSTKFSCWHASISPPCKVTS